MRALVMLLLGYTAYRMALRIREENSSRLLLTDQRPGTPQAKPTASTSRTRTTSRTTASKVSTSRPRKRL
jgi:hypothetical protein